MHSAETGRNGRPGSYLGSVTRQPLEDPPDRQRRSSGIQPIDPIEPSDPNEVTRIATPHARRGPRFSATAPSAEPIDRRALPFSAPHDRRTAPSDPPTPISEPPGSFASEPDGPAVPLAAEPDGPAVSPWHHEAGVDRDALPSSLMPEALRSDPPPQLPPSLRPTAAGRQTSAVVVLAAVLVAALAALAVWQTL